MLRLAGGQVESLFDDALPVEVRELPEDLARLDALLADAALFEPISAAWDDAGRERGRPTIPMASFVRLMVVKQRTGWGYETLVREVSDSLHLRRFCLFSLTERVPCESTVRKLVRRLGPDVVAELTRLVIAKAQREQRFRARAMRCDSTVVEADVRYPSDAALAVDAIARQIEQRLAGEQISDRLVSLADPDARPIRKGKLGKPTEFGYVFQLAEVTANTKRGARGFLLPPASRIGSPNETELLPTTAAELDRLGIRPREVALDGGFEPTTTNPALPPGTAVFIAGRQQPRSQRTKRRLARYRVGAEGRISHLKRGYGLRRARLKGHDGARTWVGWAALTYNLDTLAVQSA